MWRDVQRIFLSPVSSLKHIREGGLHLAEGGVAKPAGGVAGGVEEIKVVQIDRLGQTFKLRLPFPRAAEDRGDVKKLIVQMTQEAMANPDVQEHLATIEAKNTGAKTA